MSVDATRSKNVKGEQERGVERDRASIKDRNRGKYRERLIKGKTKAG